MANVLSQFGLAMKGANTGIQDDQSLQMGQERISAAQRQGQLQNQQIETGNIGLEELRRTQGTEEAIRQAGSQARSQGKTWSGSLLDMANAAAVKGDMDSALKYKQSYQVLEQFGAKEIINTALTNPTPGDRPDLVSVLQQYEKTQDTTGATLDASGNLTITRKSGAPSTFNVGKLGELMGLLQQPKIHNIPAGGVGVITQPGQKPYSIEAPKTYPPNRTTLKSYGEEGHPTGETVFDESGKQIATTAGGVSSAGGGGAPGGVNVRKDLPVLKEITQGVTELGEEYGKTDMSNPLNPKVTLTEKGQQVAMVAEQIRLSNTHLAPRTIIDMAVKGKPMWKIEDGKRTGVVLYNGQEFPMSTAVSRSPQPARPAPAPATAPKAAADKPGMDQQAPKPAAKPTETPAAKAARERRAAAAAETAAEIERFNKALTTLGVDRDRAVTKKGEITRSASEKERANVIRKDVAERLGRFNKDDRIWFADNVKDLTPRERKALHDRRARGGYKHGGKVGQAQHYGLG